MSTQVDNRVVSMEFDNKNFERNVHNTMSTLDKLKEKLNLSGASKGLDSVNESASKLDAPMSGLADITETVKTKFSALQVMGVTALANITNSAINTGKQMISAITIDPIMAGFSEYETQINAVQTILANTESKGTTLQQVNGALDTLNKYADKTIYNFTEMTKNIGTFTAAGVDLDTSVNAIQGIANLAAVSGSTSQQASTAMYQLSQALSSGTVKLMDWNSVVNAGMGGQVFQDALKETARNHGVAIDSMIKKQGSFRETLQEGWLTSEILTETLSHFTMAAEEGTEQWEAYKKSLMEQGYTAAQAEEIIKLSNTATNAATKVKTFTQLWDTLKEAAQSGWTQTWEIIIGDFEEAKGFLTEVSDKIGGMIGASADARNAVLSEGLSSGWKQLMGAGIADEAGYKDTFNNIAKSHGVSIDKMVAAEKKLDDSLSDSEAYQKALTKGIKDGSITSDMFSESVHTMADKMSKMSSEELKASGYTQEHVSQIKKLSKGLKDGSISMDEFVNKMSRPSGRENIVQALWNAFDGLMSIVKPIKEAFNEIFKPITGEQLYSFTEALVKLTEKLTLSETQAENLKRTFKGVFAIFSIAGQVIKALFSGFAKLVGYIAPAGNGILGFTANIGDFIVKIDEAIKSSNIFNNIIEGIGKIIKPIADGVKTFASSIATSFGEIGKSARERLQPLTLIGEGIKAIFVGLGKVVEKIAPWCISFAKAIGDVFGRLMDRITNSVKDADYSSIFDMVNGGIFAAIGVFIAKFVKSAGKILDDVGSFTESISGILDGVGEALNAFTGQIKANTLKTIATAIAILAASLLVLSLIDSDKITSSLAAITAMFIELMGAMAIFGKIAGGKGLKDMLGMYVIGTAMKSLATSILILAVALKIMSTMSWKETERALISLTAGMGVLIGAVNLLPEKKVNKAAKAIKKLATSVVIFAVGLKIMSTMSWKEMGIALISMVVGLAALVGAVHLLPKDSDKKAGKILVLAGAMVILGSALKIMASMTWTEMIRSLLTMVVGLGALVAAVNLLPKDAGRKAGQILVLSVAMVVLGSALKKMGSMSWEQMGVGLISLAVSLGALIAALHLMPKDSLKQAGAMIVLSLAMVILSKALGNMGSMSWEEVGRSIVMLAGSLLVLVGVGALLAYVVPGAVVALLSLSGAIALFGLGIALLGAGIVLIAAGIAALSVALAAGGTAIVIFISSLIGLIPYLIEQIGVGIINLCRVISGSASAICEAVTVIILALVDALVTAIPAIVDGVLKLIVALMEALVTYTPTIVGLLFDFVIGIINKLAEKLPDLIKAGVNLLMSLFQGVIDALQNIDTGVLVKGLLAMSGLTALAFGLAALAAVIPAAMVGVLGLGVLIVELGIVLAAIGALAQIPGLTWLVEQGGEFMLAVGTAIGKFIGGIVGGIAQGMSASLPRIAEDLSTFMINLQPFLIGAKTINPSSMDGVKSLIGVIVALTGANLLEGITSWITGGSSILKFASELPELGKGLSAFSTSISGMDASAVTAAASAAKAIAEMTQCIPNEGGMVSWFVGENSIAKFGSELPKLGSGLKGFSDSVNGINAEAIVSASKAAKVLSEMTATIPNEGGVSSWFAGENSISKFGDDIISLGKGLKGFADSTNGLSPDSITAAASAAKALAEMANVIPNEGGMVAWFTGDNSVSMFADQLPKLGAGLLGFSTSTMGIVPENIIAASNAAKALAEMANVIPNEGGMVSWFTGDNSIASFASQLPKLGDGLLAFSTSLIGVVPENIIAAANAAKAIAEMSTYIPNEGGMVAWFTGDNSLASFAEQLPQLGIGLLSFSMSVMGIVPENIIAAANAAKALAEMANVIPNEGGMVAWFTGDNSIASFASQLPALGAGLLGFSISAMGIVPETVQAAAIAAKAVVDLTSCIPNEGGIAAWFTGETSIASFASQLPILGAGLLGFSMATMGIVPENITAAASAAKAIAEMTAVIPKEGGIAAWFTGETSIASFADQLPKLGKGLKGFSDSVTGIVPENVTAAANAAKSLGQMASTIPGDTDDVVDFGENLVDFGKNLSEYFKNTSGITETMVSTTSNIVKSVEAVGKLDSGKIDSAIDAIEDLIDLLEDASDIDSSSADGFTSALSKLAKTSIDNLVTAFEDASSKLIDAGKAAMNKFIEGAEAQQKTVTTKLTNIVNKSAESIISKKSKFTSAGKELSNGLAAGITANTYVVEAAAKAVAKAAEKAARKQLDINSPSKVFRSIGMSVPEGFAMGITKLIGSVINASKDMGNSTISSVNNTVSKIADLINSDIDAQPTIRPVLDLSAVRAGAGSMNALFSGRTLSVDMAGVGSISASMAKFQNGSDSKEIVSSIKALRKDIADMPRNSYTINGVTYDDGTNVSDAVNSLVRAIKIERRT